MDLDDRIAGIMDHSYQGSTSGCQQSPVGVEILIVMGLQDERVCRTRAPASNAPPDRQAPGGINFHRAVPSYTIIKHCIITLKLYIVSNYSRERVLPIYKVPRYVLNGNIIIGEWVYDGTEFSIQVHSENEPNVVSLKDTKGDWIPILKY